MPQITTHRKSLFDELIKKGYSREQIAKIRIPAIIREVKEVL